MKKGIKILQASVVAFGFLSIPSADAQPFSIDWYKIAAGGGTTSGGPYLLFGTIGQHDAGRMSGGNFTLEGGFVTGIVLIQTPGAPLLSISYSGGNAVISWPAQGSAGFVLEESLNLIPASWNSSAATVISSGENMSATVPAFGNKFYRLVRP